MMFKSFKWKSVPVDDEGLAKKWVMQCVVVCAVSYVSRFWWFLIGIDLEKFKFSNFAKKENPNQDYDRTGCQILNGIFLN